MADEPSKPRLVQRMEEQRARHRQRPIIVRALYIPLGFTVLFAGLAMLLLPGPAFIVIPIGLALLSLEFAWAENLLERALVQGEIAKRKAAATTRLQRILSAIAFVCAAAAVATWGYFGDVPLLPL